MDKNGEGKTKFCQIYALAIESKDNVYTDDEDHENEITHKFTKNGKLVESCDQFGNKVQLKEVPLIIFDSKDNLYVKDTQNQPIQVFSTDTIKLKI
jgi:hypothetical protein